MPINEIKTVEVGGTEYEIKKLGWKTAATVQSIFIELALAAKIGGNMSYEEIGTALMVGMRGEVLDDIDRLIREVIISPKMTDEKMGELDPNDVTVLFTNIYQFYVGAAEKKSEQPSSTSEQKTPESSPS